MISITISSPESSYILYSIMPSPVYQYVINMVVSLPIRRGPAVLMDVSVEEHRLTTKFFDVVNLTILKPLSLLY